MEENKNVIFKYYVLVSGEVRGELSLIKKVIALP